MNKVELVQRIGCEVCENCLLARDCGYEPEDCSRIDDAIIILDQFLESIKREARGGVIWIQREDILKLLRTIK